MAIHSLLFNAGSGADRFGLTVLSMFKFHFALVIYHCMNEMHIFRVNAGLSGVPRIDCLVPHVCITA